MVYATRGRIIGKEVMDVLRENLGKEVVLTVLDFGKPREVTGVLTVVDDFRSVTIKTESSSGKTVDDMSLFAGANRVVQFITAGGSMIYDNRANAPDGTWPKDNTHDLKVATFGTEVADRLDAGLNRLAQQQEEPRKGKIATLLHSFRGKGR